MDLLTTASLQQFVFGPYVVQVLVPDPVIVRRQWEEGPMTAGAFPYWAKVWPAAKALCMYLAAQPDLFRGKRVVELGAGLGLPSLLCAREAASVACTDRSAEAVCFAEASAARTGLSVMRCAVLNWMTDPQPLPCDLLLLSDVNYDPAVGEALKALVEAYRQQHTHILLTTPQRPAGRAFAMDISDWVDRTVDVQVQDETGCVEISLFSIDAASRDGSFALA
jgi:predicted nicotinamide N-methyase